MTPYVEVQEIIVKALRRQPTEILIDLKARLKDSKSQSLSRDQKAAVVLFLLENNVAFEDYGFQIEDLAVIINEQIDDSGDVPVVRDLLGMPLHHGPPQNFEQYAESLGSGVNRLRTTRLAQPGALKKGDVLATGCKLLSEPREGGNGSVLLHLTGGIHGHWIGVPARIPIALLTPEDNVPPELTRES